MYYTIYQITNLVNGKFYIGKHISKKENDSYFGSGVILKEAIKKYGKENFKKEILFVFDSEEEMNHKEIEIVNIDFVLREDTYNIKPGGNGFIEGYVVVKDKEENAFLVSKEDKRYISGELVHISTGMVNVQDSNGNTFRVKKDDPRYLSDELTNFQKGKVIMRDENGNPVKVEEKDKHLYKGLTIGMLCAKDKHGNIFHISKDDPRYLSGELVARAQGMINITNGDRTTTISKDSPIPEGWRKGSHYPSSTKGRIWITDGYKNKQIYPSANIEEGWRKGMTKN